MNIPTNQQILSEIDAFLAETSMSESYFGKRAVGNSEVVRRLRSGRSVTLNTVARAREFIRSYDGRLRNKPAADPSVSRAEAQ